MRGFLWLWALIVINDENIAQLQMMQLDVYSVVSGLKIIKMTIFGL